MRPVSSVPDSHQVPDFVATANQLKLLNKSGNRHKYDYGHAVIVSGPSGQGGAARLAARGALRIGAGLSSVFCSHEETNEHAARLDAIMVKTYDIDQDIPDQLMALRPTAICVGPNLGLGPNSLNKLSQVLTLPIPLCIDADAITLLAQDSFLIKTMPHSQVVMTPHAGELRRLIPNAFEQTSSRTTLAMTAATKFGCTVLFKGSDTIVAQPDGNCVVVRSKPFKSTAWLATAGSGDVLSGFISGLMARGFDAFDAATLGTYLHFQCAEIIGPGLIAEDLPDALPRVLAKVLRGVD